MRLFDASFDLVFSIGGNCACAMFLKETRRRIQSSPFDWIANASFTQRFDTLCGRFEDFLHKDNLVWFSHGVGDATNEIYADRVTGYRFVHDFPKDMSFDEAFPGVRAKYDRRISRLLSQLDGGVSACLVWWSDVMHPTDAECAACAERVRKAFPKSDCRVLVFENDPEAGPSRLDVRHLSPYCTKVVGATAPAGSGFFGDHDLNVRVFRGLRLGRKLAANYRVYAFKRLIIHLLTFWHFNREDRKQARARWRDRLIKAEPRAAVGW